MMSVLLIACISIIGFVILFLLLLHLGSVSLRKTADQFISALKIQEFDVAYSMLSPDFKTRINKQIFEMHLVQYGIFDIKETRSNFGDFAVGLKTGTVKTFIIREDNKYFYLIIEMLKINDKWMIYSLNTEIQFLPT